MKTFAAGLVLAAALLCSGPAMAGFGDGLGSWWMDGEAEAPMLGVGACGTCLGQGGQGSFGAGTGLGLGLGYGDGTLPAPLDGTGFGSPWTR
jgi:hypothetical protein